MSTQNATITGEWSKLAETTDDQILIQAARPEYSATQGHIQYEIASSDTDTTPTVAGHPIYSHQEAINRQVIGDGYLYARLVYSSQDSASATLIVSGSSLTLS
jgi:hypothetical protein